MLFQRRFVSVCFNTLNRQLCLGLRHSGSLCYRYVTPFYSSLTVHQWLSYWRRCSDSQLRHMGKKNPGKTSKKIYRHRKGKRKGRTKISRKKKKIRINHSKRCGYLKKGQTNLLDRTARGDWKAWLTLLWNHHAGGILGWMSLVDGLMMCLWNGFARWAVGFLAGRNWSLAVASPANG